MAHRLAQFTVPPATVALLALTSCGSAEPEPEDRPIMTIRASGGGPVTGGNSALNYHDEVVFHASCTGGEGGTVVVEGQEVQLTCTDLGDEPDEQISEPVSIDGDEMHVDANDFGPESTVVVAVYRP